MYKKQKHPSKRVYVLRTVSCNCFFPVINSLTLSPQSFTSHHLRPYKPFPLRLPPPIPYTALHFTSFYFTLLRSLHFISFCGCRENGACKATLFLRTWIKLRLRACCKTLRHSESKERLGKICVLRHGVLHLQSCWKLHLVVHKVTRWFYTDIDR